MYQQVLDNYFGEGAYEKIEVKNPPHVPETTVCNETSCQLDGTKDVSPLNLKDLEPGPPYEDPPDGTVEFNDITFFADGTIEAVGANDAEDYDKDEVLARTLVHEMGHGLGLVGHCENPLCIMYNSVLFWEMYGHDGQSYSGSGVRAHRLHHPGLRVHRRSNVTTARVGLIILGGFFIGDQNRSV